MQINYKKNKKMQKYLLNSKKSCTFAAVFARYMCARHVNIFINRLCWAVDLPLNGT